MIPIPEKVREDRKQIQGAVRNSMIASIVGALGLVVGLAWNDAIKGAIEQIFPLGSGGILAKFGYAVILTIVIAIAVYYISKFFEKKEEEGKYLRTVFIRK